MPNTKSAKKRMQQSEKRRVNNRSVKHSLKTQIRKLRAAAAHHVDQVDGELRAFSKKVDKAAAHGVIHANTAARLKSRLSAAVKHAKEQSKAGAATTTKK